MKPPHDSGEEDNAPAKARQEHYAMQCCDVSGQAKREKIIALGRRRLESSTRSGDYSGGRDSLFGAVLKASMIRCGSIFPIPVTILLQGNLSLGLLS